MGSSFELVAGAEVEVGFFAFVFAVFSPLVWFGRFFLWGLCFVLVFGVGVGVGVGSLACVCCREVMDARAYALAGSIYALRREVYLWYVWRRVKGSDPICATDAYTRSKNHDVGS